MSLLFLRFPVIVVLMSQCGDGVLWVFWYHEDAYRLPENSMSSVPDRRKLSLITLYILLFLFKHQQLILSDFYQGIAEINS